MSGTGPSISVVVPARNAASTLAAQLDALSSQSFEDAWEVVVVDNGSTDDTAAVAAAAPTHPRCVVRIVSEPRKGLNAARNAGVRSARASRIAICDADDVVDREWLAELAIGLQDADLVSGGFCFAEINDPATCQLRGWHDIESPAASVGRELGFLDQVMCGNVAFHRSTWSAVGGFDETFEGGGDDVDFSWRVQLAGYRVGSRPTATLHYRGRATRWQMFRQYMRDGEGSAHLYAVHRENGMPRRSIRDALRSIAGLAVAALTYPVAGPARQGHLIRAAGKQLGRMRGSIRHRVVFL